jgi:ribonuclease Z
LGLVKYSSRQGDHRCFIVLAPCLDKPEKDPACEIVVVFSRFTSFVLQWPHLNELDPDRSKPAGNPLPEAQSSHGSGTMFELVFLGTSASAPSIRRGLPAAVVMHKEYRFLVDCGEGTQRQLLRSGLGFRRLDKILLTHGHLDHILGLAGIASTFSRWEMIDHMEIYGGRWALDRVEALMRVVFGRYRPPIRMVLTDLRPGTVMEDDSFLLTAFPVTHRGPGNFGFIFQEKARRPFLAEKARDLGVPAGPERAHLVRGQPITLSDGRTIHPDDVLGPSRAGTRFVFIGDAARTDNLVEAAQDADALVIEATYTTQEADVAREFGHLTARQAAELAVAANVQHLILHHISRRYTEREILDEAAPLFANTTVARDLDHYQIRRNTPPAKVERERRQPKRGKAKPTA